MSHEEPSQGSDRPRWAVLASLAYGAAALGVMAAMGFLALPLLCGVRLPALAQSVMGALLTAEFPWFTQQILTFLSSYRSGPLFMVSAYLLLGIVVGFLLHQALTPLSRWLPDHQKEGQRDELAGHFMGVVAVIYAVLVAFVVVTAWQGRSDAISIATQEQHDADDLFHLVLAHKTGDANGALVMLRYYAVYTQGEWYQMRNGDVLCTDTAESNPVCLGPYGAISRRANELAHCIRDYAFGPNGASQEPARYEEMIRMTAAFSEDRAERRLRYQDRTLQPILWLAFILGAFILVGMTSFVSGQGHRAQLVRTIAFFAMMGMMIALAFIFDRPFVGSMQVTPNTWRALVDHFDTDLGPALTRDADLKSLCKPERSPEPT